MKVVPQIIIVGQARVVEAGNEVIVNNTVTGKAMPVELSLIQEQGLRVKKLVESGSIPPGKLAEIPALAMKQVPVVAVRFVFSSPSNS